MTNKQNQPHPKSDFIPELLFIKTLVNNNKLNNHHNAWHILASDKRTTSCNTGYKTNMSFIKRKSDNKGGYTITFQPLESKKEEFKTFWNSINIIFNFTSKDIFDDFIAIKIDQHLMSRDYSISVSNNTNDRILTMTGGRGECANYVRARIGWKSFHDSLMEIMCEIDPNDIRTEPILLKFRKELQSLMEDYDGSLTANGSISPKPDLT